MKCFLKNEIQPFRREGTGNVPKLGLTFVKMTRNVSRKGSINYPKKGNKMLQVKGLEIFLGNALEMFSGEGA